MNLILQLAVERHWESKNGYRPPTETKAKSCGLNRPSSILLTGSERQKINRGLIDYGLFCQVSSLTSPHISHRHIAHKKMSNDLTVPCCSAILMLALFHVVSTNSINKAPQFFKDSSRAGWNYSKCCVNVSVPDESGAVSYSDASL